MSELITLKNASFGYSKTPILRDVSLTIHSQEFIGISGPNGAGKSTLLRGLVGLLPVLSGKLYRNPSLERRIGYVPQRDKLDSLFPLTAHEVVEMGLVGIHPWHRFLNKAHQERIASSLDQVGMLKLSHHPFADLSGGQRQRVLIARALVIDPILLVLDEPTSGIDPQAEETILNLLQSLHTSGKTILMVSHRDQSLRQFASRVLEVKGQKVAEQ